MSRTIVHDENGNAKWGNEDHLDVAQQTSFAGMIFELLSEQKPTPEELKIFELILNLSIDHGPETPSAVATIEAAKSGQTISESVAAGLLQVNDTHGGAGQPLMELLYKIKKGELQIDSLVKNKLEVGERLPGLGHRIYKGDDPRVILIFNEAEKMGLNLDFINVVKGLQDELEKQKGTRLPVNIDGAIAAILCTFGWDPKLGKAVFIIARTPGLCGQFLNNL